jgi:hypothetical protein
LRLYGGELLIAPIGRTTHFLDEITLRLAGIVHRSVEISGDLIVLTLPPAELSFPRVSRELPLLQYLVARGFDERVERSVLFL